MASTPALDSLTTELRARMSGPVITESDSEYDAARHVWNGTVERHPALIARCQGAADVATVVNFARERGLPLAVRGGGHSVPGFSTCDGGVVLDLSAMRGVEVDVANRTARAQAGCTWGDYDGVTHAHGLASPGGMISTTGISGLTLGGGIGWLSRKYGLACDSLVAVEMITASGERVRASAAENSELFWGVRGGGGNFGVVTDFEFALHPVDIVTGGLALFPLDRLAEISAFYQEYIEGLPDEFTTMLVQLTAPIAEWIPEEQHLQQTVAIAGCHCGDPDAAAIALAPVRQLGPIADVFGPMKYTEIQQMFDADYPAGKRYYFKGGFVGGLPEEMVSVIREFSARKPSLTNELDLHHLGGAIARVGDDDTAFTDRRSLFMYNVIASWEDPADDASNQAWTREMAAALDAFGGPARYVNFLGEEQPEDLVQAAYGNKRYGRLRELKRKCDPGNLFRLNQNIRP